MSLLFKLALEALILGGLGSLAAALKEKNKGSVISWWHDEAWLFGGFGAELRQKSATPLAMATVALMYFFDVIVVTVCALSGLSEELPLWETVYYLLLTVCFVAKLTLTTRYSGAQLAVTGAVLGYFYSMQVITGYRPLAYTALLILVAKDADLKKVLRTVMVCLMGDVAIKAALALNGLICNQVQLWDNGRSRMDLGQGSMNALGILVAEAAVLWLLTRFESLRWWDVLLAVACLVFIQVVPNSRSAMMFEGLVLAGLLAAKLLPGLFKCKPFQVLLCLPAPAIAAVMWRFHDHYDESVGWMKKLDSLLTGRISLAYITQYSEKEIRGGLPVWGQIFVNDRFYRVDDSYIYYAYLCGPLMVVLICAGFAFLTWRLLRQGRLELAVCVIVYAFYAAMERCLSSINLSLLFMPALLYGAAALNWHSKEPKIKGRPRQ